MLLSIVVLLSLWVIISNIYYVHRERSNQIKRHQLMALIRELVSEPHETFDTKQFGSLARQLSANTRLTGGVLAQLIQGQPGLSRAKLFDALAPYGLPRIADNELKNLQSIYTSKRLWAAANLQYLAADTTIAPALKSALEDKESTVRLASAQALSALAQVDATCLIIRSLCAHRSIPWGRIVELMPSLGQAAIAPLMTSLTDCKLDDDERAVTLAALGMLKATQAEALIDEHVNHSSKHVRIQACKALGNLYAANSIPTLISAMADNAWELRVVCAQALGKIADSAAVAALAAHLSDPVYWVRYNCADALSHISPEGLSELQKQLKSEDPFVCDVCRLIMDRQAHLAPLSDMEPA